MRYGIRGTGYAVCCTQCEVWVMCLEIWIMRIAVSNVVSEYSLGGVRSLRHESGGTGYEVQDMRCVVLGM